MASQVSGFTHFELLEEAPSIFGESFLIFSFKLITREGGKREGFP